MADVAGSSSLAEGLQQVGSFVQQQQQVGYVQGGSPLCANPACGRLSWNGCLGEFCGRSCRGLSFVSNINNSNNNSNSSSNINTRAAGSEEAACAFPGCPRGSWNRQPGGFCSRTCQTKGFSLNCQLAEGTAPWNCQLAEPPSSSSDAHVLAVDAVAGAPTSPAATTWVQAHEIVPSSGFLAVPMAPVAAATATTARLALAAGCARLGCPQASWNGQPGQFCSLGCKYSNNNNHTNHTNNTVAEGQPGTKVSAAKFAELAAQFKGSWRSGLSDPPPPAIKEIWHVHSEALLARFAAYCASIGPVQCHGHGENPGNQQRRFHGTSVLCSYNNNSNSHNNNNNYNSNKDQGSPCSQQGCTVCSIIRQGFFLSTATDGKYGRGIYSSSNSHKAFRYGNQKAMLVVGVAVGIADATASQAPLKPGCHSRVVHGSRDEIVVFNEAAMVPKFLIVFA
ncbi:unnamed protein product [Polarella glacialis]|uniref:PARP catalytic domain-containing protein n=1 Tax=Polarella glacialis TaxID=89957 RepID=A0A813IVN4_POLGL|nr:unnamed protein product [Polarella glacialis]